MFFEILSKISSRVGNRRPASSVAKGRSVAALLLRIAVRRAAGEARSGGAVYRVGEATCPGRPSQKVSEQNCAEQASKAQSGGSQSALPAARFSALPEVTDDQPRGYAELGKPAVGLCCSLLPMGSACGDALRRLLPFCEAS
jgi:hypothetical protein